MYKRQEEYIKGAEWKTMDYIRPQYFIQVDRSYWAICIDTVSYTHLDVYKRQAQGAAQPGTRYVERVNSDVHGTAE